MLANHIKCFFSVNIANAVITIFTIASLYYLMRVTLINYEVPTVVASTSTYCYWMDSYVDSNNTLQDISDVNPRKGKSIFFLETSCTPRESFDDKIIINRRQACAVESAALTNPNLDVYLLFSSPGALKVGYTTLARITHALLSYPNVKILHMNMKRLTEGTHLEKFYNSRILDLSLYPIIHASELLRFLILWKYGGIYLDLDVVVIKSLEDIVPNSAGIESNLNFVANGVFRFAPSGPGHDLAELCLKELVKNFRPDTINTNGPGLTTKLTKLLCATEMVKETSHLLNCSGFFVYPSEAFYPIPSEEWDALFDADYNLDTSRITENSYLVHVWNSLSKNKTVNVRSSVPYTILARLYCPKVFSECHDYF